MDNRDLKRAGLKVTLPRVKVLRLLESHPSGHLSVEEIYQELTRGGEEVGLATVYRVLTQFEQAGLVIKHNFEGGQAVYELNQGGHHDHIVCVRCGQVDEFVDERIERLQETIADEAGYQITDHHLTIYGICRRCRR
ncbi:MAG: ferric iron uptake transcriptional regulator [Gammaproteobacteria bacterium]|nr:ferric iron uptake transcriptional regulator [Gammaproteobacteria bacterium]